MDSVDLAVARRIAPEMVEVIQSRARILQRIQLMQPIGRRALAAALGTTERILRTEVDFLRQQGLVIAQAAGMQLSDEGQVLLSELEAALASIEGRSDLSAALSRTLSIPTVIVVSGDSDADQWVKDTLGYHAAVHLKTMLHPGDVLAVTGGTTLSAVARMMPRKGEPLPVKVVPARGGLGETVSVQANTIASELAAGLGGTSIMLHVPDQVGDETLQHLMDEPMVRQRLAEVRQATVVVHGIGDAMKMARRRQLSADEMSRLRTQDAVSEAFGYYFNSAGDTVYAMTTAGLRLADLDGMRLVMGVAGGHTKAKAIASAAKAYRMDVLVTDEGAAKSLLNLRSLTQTHQSVVDGSSEETRQK